MKTIRDPESGRYFESAEAALNFYCGSRRAQCDGCAMGVGECVLFGKKDPEKAAEFMGLRSWRTSLRRTWLSSESL